MIGGDTDVTGDGIVNSNSLIPDEDRRSVFARTSFWITDHFELYAQASHARYEGLSYYTQPTTTGVTIYADNAYLPMEVAEQMQEQDLESVTIGTSNGDMPASGSNNVRKTTRFVLGGDGDFNLFTKNIAWDAYYQYGQTKVTEQLTSTYNSERLSLATDAVYDDAGDIVCRSSLTDPGNGCVPLNRLGTGVASEDALAYVLGTPWRRQEFEQEVVAVNFNTNEVTGWADPISLAWGIEHRKESMDGYVEDQYESGWKYGNYTVTTGEYDVTEAYVEAVIPLLQGLDLNGAVRYTDYSVSGEVTTWKLGIVWSPIKDLTLRATASEDIRAPNLSELYATGTGRTNSVNIPNQGSSTFVQSLQGSTELVPEEAKTYGVGVVFEPSLLPGFAASIDYYDIEIKNVIDYLSAEQVVEYCYSYSVQSYCNNIHFDDSGTLQTIDLYYQNLNSMRSRGLDIELSYHKLLQEWFESARGELSLRALATHYIEAVTDDGVTAINEAGENTSSTPDWLYRLSAAYKLDKWNIHLTARGVSDGVISNAYIECSSNCPIVSSPYYTINDNDVADAVYFDLGFSYSFNLGGSHANVFLNINNVTDKDPVLISDPSIYSSENMPAYAQTNRSLYDVNGRTLRAGLQFEF